MSAVHVYLNALLVLSLLLLVQFSSRWYLCARKDRMRSTPPFRSFPNVAFETLPTFVSLTMALSRPFKKDRLALPFFNASLLLAIFGVMFLALTHTTDHTFSKPIPQTTLFSGYTTDHTFSKPIPQTIPFLSPYHRPYLLSAHTQTIPFFRLYHRPYLLLVHTTDHTFISPYHRPYLLLVHTTDHTLY